MPMSSKNAGRDRAVLLALLALALFATPTISWWLTAAPPWYLPYLLWLAVIVLAAWQARSPNRRKPPTER
jgi:hypothetical protein